jgi:hypothetical protein
MRRIERCGARALGARRLPCDNRPRGCRIAATGIKPMPIRTIEAIVTIEADRRLIVQLPADVPLGRHRIALVLDEASESADPAAAASAGTWKFPVVADAQWPADMPLSRTAMYDDHGR